MRELCFLFSAEFAGDEPAEGESDGAYDHGEEGNAAPIGVDEDGNGRCRDEADDGEICAGLCFMEDEFDDLGDEEDAYHDTDACRHQHAASGEETADIEGDESINKVIDGGEEDIVVAHEHQHHGAADTGNHHGGGGDNAHHKEFDDVDDGEGYIGIAPRSIADEGEPHDDGEKYKEGQSSGSVDPCSFDLGENKGQTPCDKAAEGKIRGQGIVKKQKLDKTGESHKSDAHPDENGDQQFHAFFEFAF